MKQSSLTRMMTSLGYQSLFTSKSLRRTVATATIRSDVELKSTSASSVVYKYARTVRENVDFQWVQPHMALKSKSERYAGCVSKSSTFVRWSWNHSQTTKSCSQQSRWSRKSIKTKCRRGRRRTQRVKSSLNCVKSSVNSSTIYRRRKEDSKFCMRSCCVRKRRQTGCMR